MPPGSYTIILQKLAEVSTQQAVQLAREADSRKILDKLNEVVVTGKNGTQPLVELVRIHSVWIDCHNKKQEELDQEEKDKVKEKKKIRWEVYLLILALVSDIILSILGLKP